MFIISLLGFQLYFFVILITIADQFFLLRVEKHNVSKVTIVRFFYDLRFPLTLIYSGPLSELTVLHPPNKIRKIANSRYKRPHWKKDLALISLLFIFVISPIIVILSASVSSTYLSFDQIAFGLAGAVPIASSLISRPWRFGRRLIAIEQAQQ